MNAYIRSKKRKANIIWKKLIEHEKAKYRQIMTQHTTIQMRAEKKPEELT